MYLKNARIQNIRCFEDISLSFKAARGPDEDRQLNWNVILGNNGDGKSTLLQFLAACLVDKTTAQLLLNPSENDLVRGIESFGIYGATICREENDRQQGNTPIKNERLVQYLLARQGKEIDIEGADGNKIYFPAKSEILEPSQAFQKHFGPDYSILIEDMDYLKRHAFSKSEDWGWISCGYGPFRRIAGFSSQAAMVKEPLRKRFITLFDEGASLFECESWLKELDRKASKESKDGFSRRTQSKIVEVIKGLLPGITNLLFEDEIIFLKGEERFFLDQLSDGYRSMFVLAVDILSWLEKMRDANELTRPLNETRGVVLIDEIDAHLHPRWQRQIGFWLPKAFPNIQFIVTSHSPFVAMAAGKGALAILERDPGTGAVGIRQFPGSPQGIAADRMLSDILGVENLYDVETEVLLDLFDALRTRKLKGPITEELIDKLFVKMTDAADEIPLEFDQKDLVRVLRRRKINSFEALQSFLNQRLQDQPASPQSQQLKADMDFFATYKVDLGE